MKPADSLMHATTEELSYKYCYIGAGTWVLSCEVKEGYETATNSFTHYMLIFFFFFFT
jgi:hypothetical protein